MRILVPLNNTEFLDVFIKKGADEFYIGFYDDNWVSGFGKYSDINRMSGFGRIANSYSFHEVIDIVKKIKEKNRSVFITLNANIYSKEQIDYITESYFYDIKMAGTDGIIVSDISLASAAISYGIGVVASTMCGIYNSDIAKIYEKIGVKRMIVPRDLSLNEIECICRETPDVDYEAFFMRNGCIFSDSYCLGMHRPECGATCTYIRNRKSQPVIKSSEFRDIHDTELNDYLYNNFFHNDACGMCALYRLDKIGIKSLKIVGRADDYNMVCRDIELTKNNLRIMDDSRSEEEYLKNMIFPDDASKKCLLGFSCYYPEVRF